MKNTFIVDNLSNGFGYGRGRHLWPIELVIFFTIQPILNQTVPDAEQLILEMSALLRVGVLE